MTDPDSSAFPLATPRLNAGQWVAERYEILGLLGRGGMGEVYVSRDRELDRSVALKVLPQVLQRRDSRASERFLRQARLAARAAHPAVVQIFDCGVDGELPYVVQELLTGRTLADVLADEHPLDPGQAIVLLRELCQALLAAHEAGVIHRDVKPSNLFLHRVGAARPQLKLLDFGLARLMRSPESLTRTNEVFGTLSYMAPEQLLSARGARIEADVYAVGSVFFELLTGRPPFVRRTRAELKLALLHDPAPDPRQYMSGLPVELSELCLRALAKRPEERYRGLTELLAALDAFEAPRARATRNRSPQSARFKLEQVIGRGAHGEVHAAVDSQIGRKVAIKSVQGSDVEGTYRLKREFRALCRVRHSNVVRAHGLFEERAQLVLEMELIEGVRFDEYVHGSMTRLRAATLQLCEALAAVHGAGMAHRDLKPANVLVEASGRVVLVDFGLALPEGVEGSLEGSTKYLPPEAQQRMTGPAADLYALGVMLREARVSCASDPDRDARSSEFDALRTISQRLCDRAPELRPSALEVSALLRGTSLAPRSAPPRLPFVGRKAELAALRAAFQASSSGRACLVELCGESGIGKSELLRVFLRGLPARTLVLEGRCRQDERLTFSALDLPLDQLSEHVRKLPRAAQRALFPRELSALPQVFPAFLRVELVRERTTRQFARNGTSDLQAQAYDELRELLSALSARMPLVLAIEDLHWTDAAGLELLSQLLAEPRPPALLVVLTRRARPSVPELDALLQRSATINLTLSRLQPEEAASWLAAAPGAARIAAGRLGEAASGHPYLLSLLASATEIPGSDPPSLEQALLARIRARTAPARRLLELVCVSERPLPYHILFKAAETGFTELLELEDEKLVSRCTLEGSWSLEPYHPMIRSTLLATLGAAGRARLHRCLVGLLSETTLPESLIEHLAQAGEPARALEVSLRLARQAEDQHAFGRAATLYEIVTEHVEADVRVRAELLERYAHALHAGGRSRDAARSLLRRLELVEVPAAPMLEPKASELLLLSGDVTEGLRRMQSSLARRGLSMPPDVLATLEQAAAAYRALKVRGFAFRARAPDRSESDGRETAELMLSVAMTLSHVDLRGLPFSFRAAHAALDLGDPGLAMRACAVMVWSTVSHFPNDLIEPALELCRSLSSQSPSPYGRAMLLIALSEYHHFAGRFLAAEAECERAEHLLLSECVGVAREVSGVRSMQAFLQYAHKGDFRSRVEETTRWMAEAEASGNRYQLNMLRSVHALVWVARDRPEVARQQLEQAEREWPRGVSAFEVTAVLFLDVIDRYEGDSEAHLHPAQGRSAILSSPMAQAPITRGYIELQRVWGAVCALARGDHTSGEQEMVQCALDVLRSFKLPLWSAVADAFDANFHVLAGEVATSLELLERSERTFRELHMLCLAACARRRRGELTKGLVGERVRREAERELLDLGVTRIDKWCRAYFSPFPADDARGRLTLLD